MLHRKFYFHVLNRHTMVLSSCVRQKTATPLFGRSLLRPPFKHQQSTTNLELPKPAAPESINLLDIFLIQSDGISNQFHTHAISFSRIALINFDDFTLIEAGNGLQWTSSGTSNSTLRTTKKYVTFYVAYRHLGSIGKQLFLMLDFDVI